MPATTRTPRSRPHGTPAYYLARPASAWITALRHRPPAGRYRRDVPARKEHPMNLPFLSLTPRCRG